MIGPHSNSQKTVLQTLFYYYYSEYACHVGARAALLSTPIDPSPPSHLRAIPGNGQTPLTYHCFGAKKVALASFESGSMQIRAACSARVKWGAGHSHDRARKLLEHHMAMQCSTCPKPTSSSFSNRISRGLWPHPFRDDASPGLRSIHSALVRLMHVIFITLN